MKKTLCALMVLAILMALASCVPDGNSRATEGLSYAMRTDGTYEVTGIGSATDLDIVIPSSYEGVSVSAIKSGAFSGCFNIKSVRIADGIKYIGASAFSACTALTEVTLPGTLEELGDDAFLGCTSLDFAEYNGGRYIGSKSNPYLALISAKGTDITACTVKPDTRFISSHAFYLCASLESVDIPQSVKSIGYGAFSGCFSLKSVSLTCDIEAINDETFTGCTSLETVSLPSSVTRIGNSAFMGCSALKSVSLPKHLTEIGVTAFSGCSSLLEIYIPATVQSVGSHAFSACPSLVRVECGLNALHDGFAEDFLGDSKAELVLGVQTIPLS